jgi:hypothetical protein
MWHRTSHLLFASIEEVIFAAQSRLDAKLKPIVMIGQHDQTRITPVTQPKKHFSQWTNHASQGRGGKSFEALYA